MLCVTVRPNNLLEATGNQTCTGSEYVLLTQSELDFYTASPFRLSVADGATLSMLIIGVWVAALAFRSMVKVVKTDAE